MFNYKYFQEKLQNIDLLTHEFDASNYDKVNDLPYRLDDFALIAEEYLSMADTASYYKTMDQIEEYVRIIMATGNGCDCNTAFHINNIANEYFIIACLGLQSKGKPKSFQINNKTIDRIELFPNRFKISYIFFDITKLMQFKNRQKKLLDDK